MDLARGNPKPLACLSGDPREQSGGVMVMQPVQGPPKQSSCDMSAVMPAPSRCSTGLVAKNCATRYATRYATR